MAMPFWILSQATIPVSPWKREQWMTAYFDQISFSETVLKRVYPKEKMKAIALVNNDFRANVEYIDIEWTARQERPTQWF